MWMTICIKVTTTEAGIQVSIMVPAGDLFILGTTHGITAAGIHLGIMGVGMILGIMEDGMVAGTAGTVHGTIAAGIHLGIMEAITDTEVTMDMVVVIATVSMMDITAA